MIHVIIALLSPKTVHVTPEVSAAPELSIFA